MPEKCLFPGCCRYGEKNGYCVGHRIYANGVEVKVPKEVNKVSDKRKKDNEMLKTMYPAFLAKHKKCQIASPVCTGKATVVHHSEGRSQDKLLNVKTWMASCPACNSWVEQNHFQAEQMGVKISRHKKQNNEKE